ncbi:MAG: MATE family efflux transporter [Clostridia bacterium]|nr:MATE family efflux transporter [Clostridia bacterium]
MEKQTMQENKMGVMPVGKLLVNMSLPMMASMLVMALYNIVDSIFVAQIGEDALTALSLAFPVQNLMIAVSVGIGVGINAVLSRSLGAKDEAAVARTSMNGGLVLLMCSFVFMILGATVIRPFYQAQTDIAPIIEYGVTYTSIVTVGCFGLFVQVLCERLLQSTGRTVGVMLIQASGAVVNIVLDPILIFGLFGMPKMGVAGAALATVAGQWIAAAIGIYLNVKKNPEIPLDIRGFRVHWATISKILAIGVPSVVMQSIGSIMNFCMNQILIAFSSTAVAVFGVYFKLQSFIFMPIFGLNNGSVPIVAFNYGARRADRMVQAIRYSVIGAVTIMVAGMALFQALPEQLLRFFDASEEMLRIGVPALRIISFHFPIAGVCIGCGSVFQALGFSVYSMITSLVRQLVVLIPCAYLIGTLTGSVTLVWWAFIIAEIASVTLTMLFFARIYRGVIKPILPAKA